MAQLIAVPRGSRVLRHFVFAARALFLVAEPGNRSHRPGGFPAGSMARLRNVEGSAVVEDLDTDVGHYAFWCSLWLVADDEDAGGCFDDVVCDGSELVDLQYTDALGEESLEEPEVSAGDPLRSGHT